MRGVLAIELKQENRLKQMLSHDMIQSAEILQMGQQELKAYMENMALENPVVDLDEASPEMDKNHEELLRKLVELQNTDTQNRPYYQEEEEEARQFEPAVKTSVCLQESLLEQLFYLKCTKDEARILRYMIMNLDDSGYLNCPLPELCGEAGCSEAQGEQLLMILQSLEPVGVGARNLKECLLLQLRKQEPGRAGKLAEKIVSECLEDLGKNKLELISRKIKQRLADVAEACSLIKSLNPKPGSGFANSRENGGYHKFLIPDVLVVRKEDTFEITINNQTYPQISINPYYRSLMKEDGEKETVDYIRNKVKQAEWAQHCVAQRNRTMYLLTREILNAQLDFFKGGVSRLAPLTQKKMADILGMDESTVSRAAREKYLQCQWGIFPFQFFFSRAYIPVAKPAREVQDCMSRGFIEQEGTASSAEAVKEKIRGLIAQEDKKKPYSDRILSEKLREEGICISRRTVAKYREAMRISDASGRKVFY